jgi:hypothetical protein
LGCIWPLADLHAQLAANYIIGNYNLPSDMRAQIAREVEQRRNHYMKTDRHTIEVDYHAHARELKRQVPPNAPQWSRVEVD